MVPDNEINGVTMKELGVRDFVVTGFAGDKLVLQAGMASSGWSGFEISFCDVAYMALPTMIDQAVLGYAEVDSLERVAKYFDAMDDDSRVFELVEQAWTDSSGKSLPNIRHVIVARDVQIKRVVNPNEKK
jgi:hypothetical protein